MAKIKDLTNKDFGDLKVLERDFDYVKEHNIKSNRPYWRCQCSCGKIFSVCGSSLTRKNNPTRRCIECGNKSKIRNLTGLTFYNLTVLEDAGRTKDRHVLYKCRCNCGNETLISGRDLLSGHVKSCGCLKSYGEYKIIQLLQENNTQFETQKTFKTCVFPNTKALAKFDFYIENNFLLEYDGIQHFQATGSWNTKEALQKNHERDAFKNQWCKENNIPLKRIPYWKLKNLTIEDIMGDKFLLKEENN